MFRYILLTYILIFIASCSTNNSVVQNPITNEKPKPGLFSKDSEKGISLSKILDLGKSSESSINVNGYLWRASLNILSIAPLTSTDALGGTIITDWYTKKNIKDKRIKITAYRKTSELRSDGIEVKVHVQNFKNNFWTDTYLDKNLANKIEENILNEARNLRIKSTK